MHCDSFTECKTFCVIKITDDKLHDTVTYSIIFFL